MKIEEILLNKNAKIFCDNKMVTYDDIYNQAFELSQRIDTRINSLRIGIYIKNSIEFIESFFAIHFLNCVPVFFNTYIKGEELCSECDYLGINLILTDSEGVKKIETVNNIQQSVYIVNEGKYIQQIIGSKSKDNTDNNIIAIIRTSGTGGENKYAMLTKKGVIGNIEANIKSIGLSKEDVTMVVLPMCFGYCFSAQWLTHIYLGADIVISNGFNFLEIENSIEKYRVSNILLVPTMLNLYYKVPNKINVNKYNTLKKIIFGGMFINVDVLNGVNKIFKNTQLIQTYGMTELSPRVSTKIFPKNENISKSNNVGNCIEGVQIKIDNFNDLFGEILIKSDYIMEGYYGIKAYTEEGWFRTGDIGYINENNELILCGRKKNIIIVNGINVIPEIIENIIIGYEGIENVLAYGERNDITGEQIVVLIEYNGRNRKEDILKNLKKEIRKKLPTYMYPHRILFVDKIDKTYTGKVKRNGNR